MTTAQTSNIMSRTHVQATESNIGRLGMTTRDGRTWYGLVDSVCLLNGEQVYGFVTSISDTWVGCLVYADDMVWCEKTEDMATAIDATRKYIMYETESIQAALARTTASDNIATKKRLVAMLEGVQGLEKYLHMDTNNKTL